jgi:NAD(P)-dependent dehydrogenase (short-subunit alcohol dehydrogenase family)
MAELRFDGRVAIVTGAGGGLGREHALLLASRGAKVVVNDLGGAVDGTGSSAWAAEKVVAEITSAGGTAVADGNSVATAEGGEAIVQTAVDAFGRVDILVNNAGILRDKSFAKMDLDAWDAVLAVHLRGAVCVTQPAWRRMREQRYGRIVNTSSASGLFGNFGQANYGAAKMGLVGLTKTPAIEGERDGITVNAVAPMARTRMTEHLLGTLAERLDPSLVSPLVAYLVHEDCPVSGEVFSCGGGRVARVFVGTTPGMFHPAPTPEEVRDGWAAVTAQDGYIVPRNATEEVALLAPHLQAGSRTLEP